MILTKRILGHRFKYRLIYSTYCYNTLLPYTRTCTLVTHNMLIELSVTKYDDVV